MGNGNLPKPDFAGDPPGHPFVPGEAVAVQKDDGHAVHAPRPRLGKLGAQRDLVQRRYHFARRRDALLGLDHMAVEHLRQLDLKREDIRAVLVADAQRIAETPGRHQGRSRAAALQQGVGGHRGAHANSGNGGRVVPGGEKADAVNSGVGIVARIFRQQLDGRDFTGRAPGDHIGKGTAAIDPELPTLCGMRCRHWKQGPRPLICPRPQAGINGRCEFSPRVAGRPIPGLL